LLRRFSRSQVKGQGQREAKCTFPAKGHINFRPSVRCASGGDITKNTNRRRGVMAVLFHNKPRLSHVCGYQSAISALTNSSADAITGHVREQTRHTPHSQRNAAAASRPADCGVRKEKNKAIIHIMRVYPAPICVMVGQRRRVGEGRGTIRRMIDELSGMPVWPPAVLQSRTASISRPAGPSPPGRSSLLAARAIAGNAVTHAVPVAPFSGV